MEQNLICTNRAKGNYKKILLGLTLLTSMTAFAAPKRIECMSANKKVHVALVGTTDSFDAVETMTIIKGGIFGRDEQIQNPNCMIIPRESAKGPFVIVNCEEQNLLVNQFLTKESEGSASIKVGIKRISLSCKTN